MSIAKVCRPGLFICVLALLGSNAFAQTEAIKTVAGNGIVGFSGDGGTATSATLNFPYGVAVDGSGDIFIADQSNQRIRKVTAAGVISTVAGNGTAGFGGDGGAATSAELNNPWGIAVDAAGDIFIADQSNQRIRKVTPAGVISTVAGNGTIGFSGDGGAATSAEFNNPRGVAVDVAGNLYIADSVNLRIRKVTPAGVISTIAGNMFGGFNGDGEAATSAEINGPTSVAVDGSGNIFISDSGNQRIRKITAAGIISTIAGNGTSGFSGDGGAATSAQLNFPAGIAVDGGGNVFVADNQRIRKVTPAGVISTVAGGGTGSSIGDGGPATSAELGNPWAVAVDVSDDIFIADTDNLRIREVIGTPAIPLAITTTSPLPPVFLGAAYAQTLTASGGAPPYANWAVTLGNLPGGLSLNSTTGTISGTTTGNSGLFNFTIQVSDSTGATASAALQISVGIISLQTISFPPLTSPVTYGVAPITLNATSSSGLTVSYSVTGPGTLSGSTLTITGAGTVTVTASQAGNGTFNVATPVSQHITVNPTSLMITASSLVMIYQSGSVPPITATYTGFVNGDTAASLTTQPTCSTTAISTSPVGTYPTACSGAADTNYTITYVSGLLIITQQATVPFSFTSNGSFSIVSSGTSSNVSPGWGTVQQTSSGVPPSGLAIFGFRENNILVSEAGVPASATLLTGRIYAEVNGPVNTGLAIANPNSQVATVSFYFTDAAGNSGNSGTTTIPANGQIAAFLNQAPFNGGSSLSGSFTFTSSVPVAATALLGLTNERNEFLITTLPVIDLSASTFETQVLPDFADGGGWTTQIVLVNPSDNVLTGLVQFRNPSGQNAPVTINGQTNYSFAYSIPPRSSQNFQTSGSAISASSGSVFVLSTNSLAGPSGLAIFSYRSGGITVSQAGVAAALSGLPFRMYAETSGDFNDGAVGSIETGVAVANNAGGAVTVTLELFNLDGSSTGLTGTLSIPANGQVAAFLNQIPGFTSLQAPFQGVLRVIGGVSSSVIGLRGRYNERGDFLITTTPPANEGAPPPEPLYFPDLVDGGGYTTQIVLFDALASASSGNLTFNSPSGSNLNLVWSAGPTPVSSVQISITSTSATIQTGATQQFAAMITGASNTAATWSVNNIAGGNTAVGLISASGLYTAPAAVPTANTVSVTATSVADPSKSATVSVTITQPVGATCTLQQQTTWNSMCLAQFNTNSVCSTGTILQQLACVNAATVVYNQCLTSCTPPGSLVDLTKADLNFCPFVIAP